MHGLHCSGFKVKVYANNQNANDQGTLNKRFPITGTPNFTTLFECSLSTYCYSIYHNALHRSRSNLNSISLRFCFLNEDSKYYYVQTYKRTI